MQMFCILDPLTLGDKDVLEFMMRSLRNSRNILEFRWNKLPAVKISTLVCICHITSCRLVTVHYVKKMRLLFITDKLLEKLCYKSTKVVNVILSGTYDYADLFSFVSLPQCHPKC